MNFNCQLTVSRLISIQPVACDYFLVDDKETLNARLALITSIKIVLVNGLDLLGVSSPDKM